MRFLWKKYGIDISVPEGTVLVLSIERPEAFAEIGGELYEADDGEITIFEEDRVIQLSKELITIWNPYGISCNEKKMLDQLYGELAEQANGIELYEDTQKLNSQAVSYLDRLINQVPYALCFNLELNIKGLLKLYDLRFEDDCTSLEERVIQFMRLYHQVLKRQYFVFVNLKDYFSEDTLQYIYQTAAYEKVNLIVLEGCQHGHLKGEKNIVLDQDLCIINL